MVCLLFSGGIPLAGCGGPSAQAARGPLILAAGVAALHRVGGAPRHLSRRCHLMAMSASASARPPLSCPALATQRPSSVSQMGMPSRAAVAARSVWLYCCQATSQVTYGMSPSGSYVVTMCRPGSGPKLSCSRIAATTVWPEIRCPIRRSGTSYPGS